MKLTASMSGRFFVILGMLALASPADASSGFTTRALIDGIGYRSNLIDPLNPYAADETDMLRTLLHRYGLFPKSLDLFYDEYQGGILGKEYLKRFPLLISEKFDGVNLTMVPEYHYNHGICRSNNYSSALSYMNAVNLELGKSLETDALILARHRILIICNIPKHERAVRTQNILTSLHALPKSARTTPWIKYLENIMQFYEVRFGEAERNFAELRENTTGWLRDTAGYMAVRIAKAKIDTHNPDDPAFNRSNAAAELHRAMTRYLDINAEGRYISTVRALYRYWHRVNDDRDGVIAATHRDFMEAFNPQAPAPLSRRAGLLLEATGSRWTIFQIPRADNRQRLAMHPLAVTGVLLAEIANGKSEPPDERLRLVRNDRYFPGLREFSNLLMLARTQQFHEITKRIITKNALGPLHADAQVLKARALMKTDRYREAAELWLTISEQYLIYNGLTEVATAFVRMGRFSDFARIRTSWMTDFAPKPASLSPPGPPKYLWDEFNISVENFYARFQPYRSLLKSGFNSMTDEGQNKSVFSDNALHPVIRFLAAEPVLKKHLLKKNYRQFLGVSESVFDLKFHKGLAQASRDKDGKLILAYLSLIPKIRALTSNKNDPEALTSLGYFLYSQHRFPRCSSQTFWGENIGLCKDTAPNQESENDARPIELFSKALSLYAGSPRRTVGEAQLLRIMIYCFQSWANRDGCVRGPSKNYPKSVRRGYFRRLHKFFPHAAKQTPYWY